MHSVRHPHRVPFARHPERPHEELQVLAAGAVRHKRKVQADRLPEQKVAQIWSMHFSGAGRWAIAIEHKLAVIVVDFAIRRYQRVLDWIINTGRALIMSMRAVTPEVHAYLRKAECRFQNILRRASERWAETEKAAEAWERMQRRCNRDHPKDNPWMHIGPHDEVEFLNE